MGRILRITTTVCDDETNEILSETTMKLPEEEFIKIGNAVNDGEKIGLDTVDELASKYGIQRKEIDNSEKSIHITDIN